MEGIVGCKFDFVPDDEVARGSVVEVKEPSKKKAMRGSLSDPRMGVMERGQLCPTCRKRDCKGHFGHIPLSRAIWRTGTTATLRYVLRCTCEWCGRPRWLPVRGHGAQTKKDLDRLDWAVEKFESSVGSWTHWPDRHVAELGKAFAKVPTCPWTADAMEEILQGEDLLRINEEFDAEHGTKDAVLSMFDGPPCGLPLPQYKTEYKLFLSRTYEDKAAEAMETLPDVVKWRLSQPMRPEDTREALRLMGPYLCKTLRVDKPWNLVTQVQVVPPPRTRITRFGGAEDDLTYFLREVLKSDKMLRESIARLRTAQLGGEGCNERQAAAAEAIARVSRELIALTETKRALLEGGQDVADADADIRLKSQEYYDALMEQREACAAEIREEEMLWKVLTCRIADIVNPDSTSKVEIRGAEKLLNGASAKTKRNRHGMRKRMSGKTGRFRGTMLGKRVDDSARSVIDPAPPEFDPYELGVPLAVARTLLVPEKVTPLNLERLRKTVKVGEGKLGGASMVFEPPTGDLSVARLSGGLMEGNTAERGRAISLKLMGDSERERFAEDTVEVGYTVLRHLVDGDVVMFNRQPTLHRGSWMAFLTRVVDTLSFQLPVVVTAPFNADFDGDEMNLHVPLSLEAKSEALDLMFMPNMIRGAGTNAPRCGLIMGDNAAAFDMTSKNSRLTRQEVMQAMMHIRHDCDSEGYRQKPTGRSVHERFQGPSLKIPQPAIMVPRRRARAENLPEHLWTGSQVFSMLLPKGVTLEKKVRGEKEPVSVVSGELVQGRLCKATVGSSAGGLVDHIAQTHGCNAAARFLGDAHRMTSYWISLRGGSSVALADCIAPKDLRDRVTDRVTECKRCVEDLLSSPVMRDKTREEYQSHVLKVFNRARQEIQAAVMSSIGEDNDVWRMIYTGSKGKPANLAQIMGVVGAQTFNGGLPEEFFVPSPAAERSGGDKLNGSRRTFFFCSTGERSLDSLGFAESSFSSGLDIIPMLWQIAAGRVGLIDTAVKTSRVGYAFRTMYTGTNSNAVSGDGSVRNSSNKILAFAYGDDGLDPEKLEVFEWMPKDTSHPVVKQAMLLMNSARVNLCVAGEAAPKHLWRQPVNLSKAMRGIHRGTGCGIRAPVQVEGETLEDIVVFSMREMQKADPFRVLPFPRTLEDVAAGFRDLRDGNVDLGDRTAGCRAYLASYLLGTPGLELVHARELASVMVYCMNMSLVGYGEAVGATAASSINEPLQQLTMNTFHSTGQAVTAVVSGLPALKQVIDGRDTKESAQATVFLDRPLSKSKGYAELLAKSMRSVSLESVVRDFRVVLLEPGTGDTTLDLVDALACEQFDPWDPENGQISMDKVRAKLRRVLDAELKARGIKKDLKSVLSKEETALQRRPSAYAVDLFLDSYRLHRLGMTVRHVCSAVRRMLRDDAVVVCTSSASREWTVRFRVRGVAALCKACDVDNVLEHRMTEERVAHRFKDLLIRKLQVHGVTGIDAAVAVESSRYSLDDDGEVEESKEYCIKTSGSDLQTLISLPGVDGRRSRTTNVVEILDTLGVEAAHRAIRDQLSGILGDKTDPRHLMHVADTMTQGGTVMGFKRDQMKPMTAGPIARIAFEETIRQLNVAASHGQVDPMTDLIASTVLGQKQNRIGTGAVRMRSVDNTQDPVRANREIVAPLKLQGMLREEDGPFVGFRAALKIAKARDGVVGGLYDLDDDGADDESMEAVPALELPDEADDDEEAAVQPLVPDLRMLRWAEDDLTLVRSCAAGMDSVLNLAVSRLGARTKSLLPSVAELEVRLGKWSKGKFVSGVSQEMFGAALQALESYKGWDSCSRGWDHTLDVFFAVDGSPVRTTVAYDERTMRAGQLRRSHVVKRRLETVNGTTGVPGLDLRFAVSTEADVPVTALPDSIVPSQVRIKMRKSFRKGCWRYDLTRVWQAATVVEAERLMSQKETSFEVEAECLCPDVMVGRLGFTERDLATSVMMRGAELCRAAAAEGNDVTICLAE